jgi:hypothetical protein
MSTELERFMEIWEREAAKTQKLLEALPRDAYDFRPDPRAAPSASWPGTSSRPRATARSVSNGESLPAM